MSNATFSTPDLTTFCRLDELGLVATGLRLEPDQAVIECRLVEPDPWCRKVWREDSSQAAPERAKISRGGLRWLLEALVLDHLTVARAAANLGCPGRGTPDAHR